VDYLISTDYVSPPAGGVRYDDPAFRIDWPLGPTKMSEKDRSWPDFALVITESDGGS
jgi:dTDP-4-dehydrorhamnose 3,5-epimerase